MTTLTEATSTIRVYLVEDQALLRESLQAMLEPEPQVEFAGTASGGEEALEELQDLEVDVVLMNIRLPGMDGIETIRLLKEKRPDITVVMLTSYADEYLEDAIEAGAAGYMLKSCTRHQLVEALWTALRGEMPIDTSLTVGLVHELFESRKTLRERLLTSRQARILKLVANGVRYNEIATKLFISKSTVNRELREIFDQLGANDATHAVSEAYKRNII